MILEKEEAGENGEQPLKEEAIQTPEAMRKIILTQAQLKLLAAGYDFPTFHQIVVGCFVRVNVPGLPQNYSDRIFLDQIVDVLEPHSYQHLWLNARYRLQHLGDCEIERIVNLKVQQDSELQPWFDYMDAKGETLPTISFVKQKEQALAMAIQELAAKEKAGEDSNKTATRVQIKRENLAQIVLNPVALRQLSKLNFEKFRKTVTGCFVCMPAIRKDKPKDCQYHVVRVLDCVQGPRQYKVRNVAMVNYQLVLPHYGNYIINWVKSFSIVTDEGFRHWIEDMKTWKEPIPKLEEICEKAAELQLALGEAEKIPSLVEVERHRIEREEREKRAKLPVQSAKDLDPCVLSQQQLRKLAAMDDIEAMIRVLTGCFFVRVAAGDNADSEELDQILNVEVKEKRAGQVDKVLELKYTGTISLTALTYIVSDKKLSEKGFKEFVKKIESEKDEKLPNNEFVDRKRAEIREVFKDEQQKEEAVGSKSNDGQQKKGKETSTADGGAKAGANESKDKEESADERTQAQSAAPFGYPTKDGLLSVMQMRKVLISIKKITDLMNCEKETMNRVVRGFFARIAVKRNDKDSKHQYFVDQITGISWSGEPYRFRGNILTDTRFHMKRLGVKLLSDLYRAQGDNFSDDALTLFVEDWKKWKYELPTLAFIDKKNRELMDATNGKPSKFARNIRSMREIVYIGGRRPVINPVLSTNANPRFDQVQQNIQKQLVSSVRATPGLGQNWAAPIAINNPMLLAPQQQRQPSLLDPMSANWQQQCQAADTFFGGSMPMGFTGYDGGGGGGLGMERETWRVHQQQQSAQAQSSSRKQPKREYQDSQFGSFNELHNIESLLNIRSFPNSSRPRSPPESSYQQQWHSGGGYDYRRSMDADQLFGLSNVGGTSSSSSMSHYNTAYMPEVKRSRYSPQPPPVERFF